MISLVVMLATLDGNSQTKSSKWQTDTIKVSSQCGMCKDRIEENLAFEKGVKKSDVDLENGVLVITYNIKKTELETIRKAISKMGYDADDVVANKKAYSKLPGCCKKPDDPDHESHIE